MIFFIFQQIKLCLNKGLQKYNKLMNIYRKNIRFIEIFMICFDIPSKLSFLPTTLLSRKSG